MFGLVIFLVVLPSCQAANFRNRSGSQQEKSSLTSGQPSTTPTIEARFHTVKEGENLFGIAEDYGLEPEGILWANDILLNDPSILKPGMILRIPPTNGVYYVWEFGDTLEKVARQHQVTAETIINWPGNGLLADQVTPGVELEIQPGTELFIPGGVRLLTGK